MKRVLEVVLLEILQPVEKRFPFVCPVEPVLPFRFERFLDFIAESPKRNAIRRIENFQAPMLGDCTDGARLCEMMCPRKTSTERRRAQPDERPPRRRPRSARRVRGGR